MTIELVSENKVPTFPSYSFQISISALSLRRFDISVCLHPTHSFHIYAFTEAQTECGTISQHWAQHWGGLQIKMPSPGCAHQAVQRRSPGRFTTYFLFYGPFLIHHNTASILLTSPAKHTSLPVQSVFLSLCTHPPLQHPSPPRSHDANKNRCVKT